MLSGPLPAPVRMATADARAVEVRGVPGQLAVVDGRATGLAWQERDGRAWLLQSTGNSEAEVVAYADALDLAADGSARLPEAMTRGYRDLGTSPGSRGEAWVSWRVVYRTAAGREVTVETFEPDLPAAAWLAGGRAELSREVLVGSRRGVYFTNGDTFGHGLQLLEWEPAAGVRAMVSGVDLSLDELLELATGLRVAEADEPVVTGAR